MRKNRIGIFIILSIILGISYLIAESITHNSIGLTLMISFLVAPSFAPLLHTGESKAKR